MQLPKKMKKELLEIIKNKYQNLIDLEELILFLEQFIDSIDEQHQSTKNKFEILLKKYNFKTIPNFSEYSEYPYVTLFKGVDSWTLCPVIDYEGGVGDMDEEIGILFNDPELYPSFENEELEDLTWSLKTQIILTWLSSIWFEIDGPSYGIVVKTLENNSSSGFIFNDLAWDDLSILNHYNDKSKPVDRFFKITPNILDIYQRVSLETYPVYPYLNKWRYFKKNNLIEEIVSYGNETGKKTSEQSIENLKISKHKTLFDRLKYELDESIKLIERGFIEFLPKKTSNTPIYEGAIETKFHSGQHWYSNEQSNRLDISEIESFEKKYAIKLPFYFKHYLRLFNGRKYNNINLNFSIGNGKYIKVKEFLNYEELEILVSKQANNGIIKSLFKKSNYPEKWLQIGKDDNENKILINLDSSIVGLQKENGEINPFNITFEEFIKEPKNH